MMVSSRFFSVFCIKNFIVFLLFFIVSNLFAQYEKKLIPSDGGNNDKFGTSVAIDGEYAVIGASGENAVYVYHKVDSLWIEEAKITVANILPNANFGISVEICGDYIVAGAYLDRINNAYTGAAYIFQRNGMNWVQHSKLVASDGNDSDYFGFDVAIDSNYVVIGAPNDDNSSANEGSVYLFKRYGTNWVEEQKFVVQSAPTGGNIGYSVSINGNNIVAGAPNSIFQSQYTGLTYFWNQSETDSTWSNAQYVVPNFYNNGERFGFSVSIVGDIATIGSNTGNPNSGGVAYVFRKQGSFWIEEARLLPSDVHAGNNFGRAVCISSNGKICIGSPGDNGNGTSSGAVYVFKESNNSWVQESKLIASDGDIDDVFGTSVYIEGNYIVVGAKGDGSNGSNSGSAYIKSVNNFVNGNVTKNVSVDGVLSFDEGSSNSLSVDEDTGIDIFFSGVSNSSSILCKSFYEIPANSFNVSGNIPPFRWVITNNGLVFNNAEIRINLDSLPIALTNSGSYSIYKRPTEGVGAFSKLATTFTGNQLIANTNSFSEFIIAEDDVGLPVKLINFKAISENGYINLSWKTETEQNNLGFKIKRSKYEKGTFETIATYKEFENLIGQGNSAFGKDYQWNDINVEENTKYFYLLSDVDFEGNEFEHNDLISSVNIGNQKDFDKEFDFSLLQNYPNPFNPTTKIVYKLLSDSKVHLTIFNLLGEKVKTLVDGSSVIAGKHTVSWNGKDEFGNSVSSGIYFYKISIGNESIVKKMLLLR